MSDEMKNHSKPYKGSGIQGIGDTLKMYNEYDMNKLNDSIGPEQHGKTNPGKYNKNS